jgi:methionine-rich copper-binding protein CopC
MTHSDPADGAAVAASPARVTAQFREKFDSNGSTMIVVDAAGQAVSDGSGKVDLNDPDHATMIATLRTSLADGTYTVRWHVLETDGDATDGKFTFIVQTGAASQQPEATATAKPALSPVGVVGPTASPIAVVLPQPPSELPDTGSSGVWMLETLAGVVVVLGLGEAIRRTASAGPRQAASNNDAIEAPGS